MNPSDEATATLQRVLSDARKRLGREPSVSELKRWAAVYRHIADRLESLASGADADEATAALDRAGLLPMVREACDAARFTIAQFLSHDRSSPRLVALRERTWAKAYAMRDPVTKKRLYSLPELGRLFNRDHTASWLPFEASMSQRDLFPEDKPLPHGNTRCRRVGCGRTLARHPAPACPGFLAPEDITPSRKRNVATSEASYREAYERGIRRASSQPFAVIGVRVGAVLGSVARTYALTDGVPIVGAALLVWIEDKAFAFREATAAQPQYWGGWQPFNFAKWMAMGGTTSAPKENTNLQPLPELPRKRK